MKECLNVLEGVLWVQWGEGVNVDFAEPDQESDLNWKDDTSESQAEEKKRKYVRRRKNESMIAPFINASNANIEDFALSARTVWCDRKRATQKIFDRAKETLMQE